MRSQIITRKLHPHHKGRDNNIIIVVKATPHNYNNGVYSVFGFCWCRADDVRVTRINDGQGAHSEVFPTGSAQRNVVTTVIMNACLGKHSIVLDLTLPALQKQITYNIPPQFFVLDTHFGSCTQEYSTSIVTKINNHPTHLSGGALLARMTSLALPSLRVLMVER